MRYYTDRDTLYLRGSFRAASTGINGGIRRVTSIFNHSVPHKWTHTDPPAELALVAAGAGLSSDYFGLLTAVDMNNLCVLQYDFVMVFITAGISTQNPPGPGTINIIVYSREGMTEGALLETIIIATEAKADALRSAGHSFSGTPTDEMVVSFEGEVRHEYAGILTDLGTRVYAAVRFGVGEALKRHNGEIVREKPSLFVYSRFGGEHWAEWLPENCPYYPCHFEGQACDFCYCPFYPCGDETLGESMTSSTNGIVWNCSRCTLLHEPEVASYLKKHPGASLTELKRVGRKRKVN